MPDDVLPVDAGIAAFVTLVGLTAHMVEHVLLGERQKDSRLRSASPPVAPHHSPSATVGAGSQNERVLPGSGPARVADSSHREHLLCTIPPTDHLIEEDTEAQSKVTCHSPRVTL